MERPWIWLWIVAGIALLFMLLTIGQWLSARRRDRQLSYMHSKLNEIIDQSSSEKLLLFTEDKKLQQHLIVLNKLLDHTRQTKADYARIEMSMKRMLANMSHDLKTPLTVVLGLTETVATDKGISMDERERLLGKIHQKSLEIVNLMNHFFDAAKLEARDTNLTLAKLELNRICRDAILFFYESITGKGLEAVIDIPDTPIYALGNIDALERILHNLMANAIAYGADGGAVGVSLAVTDDHVLIEVWDRGKGIVPHEQERIFERLYTLEDSRNNAYQGSGLGLSITKRLAELLGGTITLQSIPHEKTSFTLQLKRIERLS